MDKILILRNDITPIEYVENAKSEGLECTGARFIGYNPFNIADKFFFFYVNYFYSFGKYVVIKHEEGASSSYIYDWPKEYYWASEYNVKEIKEEIE